MYLALMLAYVIMVLTGGTALWIIARLFSTVKPNIIVCLAGAGIAELVSILKIPYIPFVILFFVLLKIGNFDAVPAFFATMLYTIIKLFLFGIIVTTLAGVIG